jgi:chromosome segregation ATPase
VGLVHAQTHLQLVQRTFDALRQSQAALDHGDFDKARSLLTDIGATVETLRGTADQYSTQAGTLADQRQKEAEAVATQSTKAYQDEQTEDKAVRDHLPQIAGKERQIHETVEQRRQLEREKEKMERKSKSLMARRYAELSFRGAEFRQLPTLINDKQTQIDRLQSELNNLNQQLNQHQTAVAQARQRIQELGQRRAELDKQLLTLRAAVVNLQDASVFWKELTILIDHQKSGSVENLKENLRLRLKRAGAHSTTPVFDSYDKLEFVTLEDALKNFAQTLDNGTNILTKS